MPNLLHLVLRVSSRHRRCGLYALGLLAAALALCGTGLAQATPAGACGQSLTAQSQSGQGWPCLPTQTIQPEGVSASTRVLVVFLPDADGGRSTLPADSGTAFELARQLKATTVAVQAPADPGRAGEGSADHVAALAATLGQVRSTHPGKKILLVGHASGAALAAVLAARFPASADAYLLAACPCDAPARRSTPPAGLSPLAETRQMPPGTRIAVVVGNRDDRTPPGLSEAYVAALRARGVATRLTYAMGATHVSVQRAPEFFMLAQALADGLAASARGAGP